MNKYHQIIHPSFNQTYIKQIIIKHKTIHSFDLLNDNIDLKTVESFGEEWEKFDAFSATEIENIGNEYFDIVPDDIFNNQETRALDLGCGSGRWSIYLSSKVKSIDAIDPSKAIFSAARLANDIPNIQFSQASVDNIPFDDETFDFGMSLGVLHHIPDTRDALNKFAKKIKPNGYALIYLYYALDNRSSIYRFIFNLSTLVRKAISKFPTRLKKISCDIIAFTVYLPFVGLSWFVKLISGNRFYKKIPLHYYLSKSLNVIRNDSLDRFGTPLEQRFTKEKIEEMMHNAGFYELIFSDKMPYWHVVGRKKSI